MSHLRINITQSVKNPAKSQCVQNCWKEKSVLFFQPYLYESHILEDGLNETNGQIGSQPVEKEIVVRRGKLEFHLESGG